MADVEAMKTISGPSGSAIMPVPVSHWNIHEHVVIYTGKPIHLSWVIINICCYIG